MKQIADMLNELRPVFIILLAPLFTLIGVFIGGRLANESAERQGSQNRKHQLRLAALDRRLDVHQKAYALWIKIRSEPSENNFMECQQFWVENGLYLSARAREAFKISCWAAFQQNRTFRQGGFTTEQIEENLRRIEQAGPAIEEGVELPPLSEKEFLKSLTDVPSKRDTPNVGT